MTLRVHGGEAGGRRIRAPRGIRPSQGVVKEAVFNMLGSRVLEADVLDLFAGSGAVGIEALSRGAASATFVERDRDHCRVLRGNLEALGYSGRAQVVGEDVRRFLLRPAEDLARFRLVFADAPYGDSQLGEALVLLDARLAPGATVVVEHGRRDRLPPLARLQAVRERRYGATSVTILDAA